MPSNDEIEAALTEHHALFGGDAHVASLRAPAGRGARLDASPRAWEPLLVGGVAAGWATEHSDVRLELVADDPKAVEIELAGHGVAYAALPARDGDAATHLRDRIAAASRSGFVDRHAERSGATARARTTSRGSTAEALSALIARERRVSRPPGAQRQR